MEKKAGWLNILLRRKLIANGLSIHRFSVLLFTNRKLVNSHGSTKILAHHGKDSMSSCPPIIKKIHSFIPRIYYFPSSFLLPYSIQSSSSQPSQCNASHTSTFMHLHYASTLLPKYKEGKSYYPLDLMILWNKVSKLMDIWIPVHTDTCWCNNAM